MMKRAPWYLLLSLALAAGFLIGHFADARVHAAGQASELVIPKPVEMSNTFAALAKRLEPSVVTITATVGQRRPRPVSGGNNDEDNPEDMLRRFFGGNTPRQFRGYQMGSGVIVDANGYIITNHHVVNRADRIQVRLADDPTDYDAKLIGFDKETDLAVVKVDAGKKLAPAAIGNSDAVQVGEWAIAIGAPFGYERSVTAGIISAKGRDLHDRDPEHPLPRFLQTDAAINQGNSGGPLLNIRGEVIGINSAIESESGGFEGIGFAIPVNLVAKVYNDIIRSGKVSRGAIGVLFNSKAKPELLKAYGASQGVFVEQVTSGGPAEKAGMQAGDIITEFQGRPVKNGDEMLALVQEAAVGSECEVTVLRDSKKLNLKLEVADRGALSASTASPGRPGRQKQEEPAAEAESTPVRFGFKVQELSVSDRKDLGFSSPGIIIDMVEPASFAEDIGLREGDIVTHMNRQPVQSIADLKRLQGSLKPGDAVAFRVSRNVRQRGSEWQSIYLAGTVPNK
jgi:serine protease Do